MFVEVELIDQDHQVVGHGTCIVETHSDGDVTAHTFRSAAKPDQDWPLPPRHAFRLNLDAR